MEVVQEQRRTIAPVEESELPEVRDTAMPSSRASFRDEAAEAAEAEAKAKEDAEQAPEGQAKPAEQSELLVGKFKTVEELGKSYQELEAHATRLAQEMSSLKKTQSQSSPETGTEFEIPKDLEEELFNSPKTAVKKIIKMAAETALAEVKRESSHQSRQTDVEQTRNWFEKECADLAGNRAAALMIEGLAAEAEGSTMLEKFQHATKTYREVVKGSAVAAETKAREAAAETHRQIQAAAMPDTKKASGNGRKVWKASDIEWLMEHDTTQYQRLQGEIIKARQEGRVREDL